ncbi:DUF1909-domain-containing protein [Gonapodya prolifera JEL478]|uniref:DUF1909-domain-containing protein n=1 Tax=Gonapodya prolifera (strain JEL478) TaxID=1344416 RepID=A0A139AE84_GONPJ|nr:DUF1909-domain-containing protein [Gonapodya prolifera JEL478]|eukprot:KXS15122.1 DUF1909-domain-containing protein [Gonapodya prolifera JEL478]
MGNGARSQQKRERNADKGAKKGPTSQLKENEAAKSILCTICKQQFLCTAREGNLKDHAENKHSKTLADCFPTFTATA